MVENDFFETHDDYLNLSTMNHHLNLISSISIDSSSLSDFPEENLEILENYIRIIDLKCPNPVSIGTDSLLSIDVSEISTKAKPIFQPNPKLNLQSSPVSELPPVITNRKDDHRLQLEDWLDNVL